MTRTPREVFEHHIQAVAAGDLDSIVADYTEDAVFITGEGVQRGRNGIRDAFARIIGDLPQASWNLKTLVYAGDVLLVWWTADAGRTRVEDGVETYVFRDGLIRAETSSFELLRARI